MLPLVTVIIPTYNYGVYIKRAVDSVLHQSYHNIEVIVVDDGSTDDTVAILHGYSDRLYYVYQDNQGAAAARNRGLQEANGDYICFLDADDMYHANNIEEKVIFLEADPQSDWCYSNWAWVDASGKEMMRGNEPKASLAHIKAQGDVLSLALQGYRLGTNVFMFRNALIDKLEGFDINLRVLEDYDYYVRAASLAKLGFVDKVLVDVYQHEDSLGTGCDMGVAYLNRLRLHHKLKRLFSSELQKKEVKHAWQVQQADLYRNLAVVMLDRGHVYRAGVLLYTSLQYCCWQLGAWLLGLKIVWAKVV